MKSRDRLVFDTSVVVSAVLIASSHPAEAFRKARQIGDILLSLPVAEELNEVLGRERFDRYLIKEDRDRFLAAFIHAVKFLEVTERIVACWDYKDDKFLELAVLDELAADNEHAFGP